MIRHHPAPGYGGVNQNEPARLTMPQTARVRRSSPKPLSDSAIHILSEVSLRPPLKWAGGKRWQVPHAAPALGRAHAPAAGRAVLRRTRGRAGLMPASRAAQRRQSASHQSLPLAAAGADDRRRDGERSEQLYYASRSASTNCCEPARAARREAASLFYYLNRTGYNGLCRFNRKRRLQRAVRPLQEDQLPHGLLRVPPVFCALEFTQTDFERLPLRPDDFVYADPPYDVEFTQVLERRVRMGRTEARR